MRDEDLYFKIKQNFIKKHIYDFDYSSEPIVHEDKVLNKFNNILNRIEKLGLGIYGIEYYEHINSDSGIVDCFEDWNLQCTDPNWYRESLKHHSSIGLKYAKIDCTFFVPDNVLLKFKNENNL